MINISKYSYSGIRNLIDVERNLFDFVVLFISSWGIFWLAYNDNPAGILYTYLFIYSIIILFLYIFWTKDSSHSTEIPISQSMHHSITFYIFGWLIPIFLYLIFSFKTSSLFIPLKFTAQSLQTFESLTISASKFWQFFITVWTAGTIEGWVAGFAIVASGILIGRFVRQIFNLDFSKSGNKWFDFSIAMIVSVIFFVVMHSFNQSYNNYTMFFIAGIFKLVENIGIYVFNLMISFAFGFHQSNNAIFLGLNNVWQGLSSSIGGIIIMGFWALILFYFFKNIKHLPKIFKNLEIRL